MEMGAVVRWWNEAEPSGWHYGKLVRTEKAMAYVRQFGARSDIKVPVSELRPAYEDELKARPVRRSNAPS